MAATWILTGSPENYETTRELGFTLIGMKERRRRMAESMLPGDRIVLYLTRVKAFAGSMRLVSDMFEDRTPVWPAENWTLAFQGQLRTVSERDARVLMEAMGERARTPA